MNVLYIDIVSENCTSTILKQRLVKSEEIKQGYINQELILNKSHKNVEIRLYYIYQLQNIKDSIKSFLRKRKIINEQEKLTISLSALTVTFVKQ